MHGPFTFVGSSENGEKRKTAASVRLTVGALVVDGLRGRGDLDPELRPAPRAPHPAAESGVGRGSC